MLEGGPWTVNEAHFMARSSRQEQVSRPGNALVSTLRPHARGPITRRHGFGPARFAIWTVRWQARLTD